MNALMPGVLGAHRDHDWDYKERAYQDPSHHFSATNTNFQLGLYLDP